MKKTRSARIKVTFIFTAPEATRVQVAGDFTGWDQAPLELKKDKKGVWKKTVSLAPGRHEYRMLVNGRWQDDPACPHRTPNQFGGENCVFVVEQTGAEASA